MTRYVCRSWSLNWGTVLPLSVGVMSYSLFNSAFVLLVMWTFLKIWIIKPWGNIHLLKIFCDFLPCHSFAFHFIGNIHIFWPNIKLVLHFADDSANDFPRVNPYSHVDSQIVLVPKCPKITHFELKILKKRCNDSPNICDYFNHLQSQINAGFSRIGRWLWW